jgi:hypothetical protein
MMPLYFKRQDGTVIELQCDVYDCMAEVRRRLAEKIGIPAALVRLIFAGKQLEDGRTLQDYCIQKESTLHVVLRKLPNGEEPKPLFDAAGHMAAPWKPQLVQAEWPVERCLDKRRGEAPVVVAGGVRRVRMLSEEFAAALYAEIHRFCLVTGDSGVALRMEHLGLSPWLDKLIEPIVRGTMGACEGMLLKAMRYEAAARKNSDWPEHRDGDKGTLNICLGRGFEGGLLRVASGRGRDGEEKAVELEHKDVGSALVHSGKLYHSVTPVTAGTRIVLIVKVY